MINAKIVGAGGYGGVGIAELINAHPETEIAALVDIENVGMRLSDLYPHLSGIIDREIVSPENADFPCDVVFMATPDGVGMKLAPAELEKGARVIDYSGDFRFNTAESYSEYAQRIGRAPRHASAGLLKETVYGLPELHRSAISGDITIVGNPGCFAVSCILGLAPAVAAGTVDIGSIICDCKTGISGAGKKPSPFFHYPAVYDNMFAYKLSGHQHVCEIERELGILAGTLLRITFTSQVAPACRGIMSCLYGNLKDRADTKQIIDTYREYYSDSPFVRVFDSAGTPGTVHVRGTNFCNLVISVDNATNRLRVVSYIDNLMKGQAGSAMQNMNLLFGFPETLGLTRTGMFP